MGTFNFGEPNYTEGVKVIWDSSDEEDEVCEDVYSVYADELSEEACDLVSNIHCQILHNLNDEFRLTVTLESIEPTIVSGYYSGIAIDIESYDLEYELEQLIDNEWTTSIPDMDDKLYDELAEILKGLDESAIYETIDNVQYSGVVNVDYIDEESVFKELMEDVISNNINHHFPTSMSVGWVTGEFETNCRLITKEDFDISIWSDLNWKESLYDN